MTKFYYSELTGMTQVSDDSPVGSSTEREALLKFYIDLRTSLQAKIDKHQRFIDNIRDDMRALDDKYGYIKDEYPEEFL